jgi:CubicO group peptidase (beta-lactamase class C family)
MSAFPRAQSVLHDAVASRVAPCAVVEVGDCSRVLWREASGRSTYDVAAPRAAEDTVFDLASLTKVLATATLAMRLVDDGRLSLDARVADVLPCWRGCDRNAVRVRDLLTHSSGLPAHKPLYRFCAGRADFELAICSEPLEYMPGTRSVYSDLGFILLGFVLEDVAAEPLDRQFERLRRAVPDDTDESRAAATGSPIEIQFRAPTDWLARVAPTQPDEAHLGIVNDANAAALGGVAGHAGLFGTAPAVGTMARAVLRAALGGHDEPALARHEIVSRFVSKAGIPGSSRALGWDTMLPTSSCGSRMSAQTFGHTGFTGTSLWIDPTQERYVVLLTNRVYPTPSDANGITNVRRALHDAIVADRGISNREG